jgi:hypothetical protein
METAMLGSGTGNWSGEQTGDRDNRAPPLTRPQEHPRRADPKGALRPDRTGNMISNEAQQNESGSTRTRHENENEQSDNGWMWATRKNQQQEPQIAQIQNKFKREIRGTQMRSKFVHLSLKATSMMI